tara:strand:- start:10822 stop:11016 length:195 start_codon:yes stop_codon:yes gene_type:complete
MLTEKGFDDRYYFYCKKSKTYSEAYKKTEKEFFKYFNINKYSSYDSFRVSHNNRIKKEKKLSFI